MSTMIPRRKMAGNLSAKILLIAIMALQDATSLPITQTPLTSFQYANKVIRIWALPTDPPLSGSNFLYDPLFVPELYENGKPYQSKSSGKHWNTHFTIILDSDDASHAAFERVKEIYQNISESQIHYMKALHVTQVKIMIPGLFDNVEAHFVNPKSGDSKEAAHFTFTATQVRKFRVTISSRDYETAKQVEELLENSQIFYEITIKTSLHSEDDELDLAKTLSGVIDFIDYSGISKQYGDIEAVFNRLQRPYAELLSNSSEYLRNAVAENKADMENLRSDILKMFNDHKELLNTAANKTEMQSLKSDLLENFSKHEKLNELETMNMKADIENLKSEISERLSKLEMRQKQLFRCPSDWLTFVTPTKLKKCFWIGTRSTNWKQNEEICEKMNSTMIEVDSHEENDFVTDHVKAKPYIGIFLGAKRTSNNEFVWRSGKPLNYIKWNSGEPNNKGGNENCLQVLHTGYWNDMGCDEKFYGGDPLYPGCQLTLGQIF